jgi:hypothetical protein
MSTDAKAPTFVAKLKSREAVAEGTMAFSPKDLPASLSPQSSSLT